MASLRLPNEEPSNAALEAQAKFTRYVGSLDFIIRQTITYLEVTGQAHAAKTLSEWREKVHRDAGFADSPAG